MPIKFPKTATTHLIKFVRKVTVSFNPLDVRAVSAREILRQVTTMRFKDSNPKLVVERLMTYSTNPPVANFTYIDGTDDAFDTQEYTAKEMMETIWLKTTGISCEYEMAGKSIDDDAS